MRPTYRIYSGQTGQDIGTVWLSEDKQSLIGKFPVSNIILMSDNTVIPIEALKEAVADALKR